jgi:hypothetical protein
MRLDIDEIAHRDLARRWAAGRDADPAIAHHHCGDAVPARRGDRRIPADLRVIVSMPIDKPRSDDTFGGIDNALRAVGDLADFSDFPRRDGDIGAPCRRPAAVDDGPVLDQQVVGSSFLHRKTVRSSFCDPRTGRPVALKRSAAGRWESTVSRRFTEQP